MSASGSIWFRRQQLQSLTLAFAEFSQIHQDEVKLPADEKNPIRLLIVARPWLPKTFKALRRTPTTDLLGR